jgi:catechol 2,3-dioxygenase-like lactoylglutathione lyase family enzyme
LLPTASKARIPAEQGSQVVTIREGRRRDAMIQANGIDHIVLHVNDVARAKRFYTEVLGMTAYEENDRQVFLHAGPQGVALFKRQGDTPLAAGNDLNHLALNVTAGTYEGLKAELEKHGVAVSGRPGEDRCIYFRDPDGHRLQLMIRER